MQLTASSCANPTLLAAANHVYAAYYSKPYPPPAAGAVGAHWIDWQPMFGIHRRNHGLAHALRKVCLVRKVAAAFRVKQGGLYSFPEEMLDAMQVAMLFEVCGRQSEAGWSDDATKHTQYRTASRAAFRDWATPTNSISKENATICFDALERMFITEKTSASAPVKAVFEVCHDLDLFRCYGIQMRGKLSELEQLFGEYEAGQLARLAVQMIKKTGDLTLTLTQTQTLALTLTLTLTLTRRS